MHVSHVESVTQKYVILTPPPKGVDLVGEIQKRSRALSRFAVTGALTTLSERVQKKGKYRTWYSIR